ncbi:putative lumazine-binding protein [Arcticibacter pallidicorallinus]|uniref:Putative lumazine-binding protein n=1 Tax=Arcticibacter pallidicorallinus TaxID=1259464 RepID=A0A2T0U5N2_9SPHI|nr:nuclear transport factor 2 family protein [Arcticibacter pallidicorallinus]PRY53158.1 putative lumazine-binding protein [Arcticibacter pallidicorallinus]
MAAISVSAFAEDEKSSEKLRMDYTVKTYIDAVTLGKVSDLASVLESDAKFTLTQGERIVKFSRYETLNWMKSSEGVRQNCSTDFKIIEMDASQAVVKITMTYDTFLKVNLLSLANTKKGWKITNVSTSFINE